MSSTLTIEELSGQKRKIELKGGGLPFRPASWSGETTVATQWYPGNAEASQQVLGPRELPSDWEGFWRTTQLLRSPAIWYSSPTSSGEPIVAAAVLVENLDSIRRSGQYLRVTWSSESEAPTGYGGEPLGQRRVKMVRVGRLTAAAWSFETVDDCGWKLTFTWTGRGDSQVKVQKSKTDVVAAMQKAIRSQEGVDATARKSRLVGSKYAPTTFDLGQLEAVVDAPLALVDSFARVAVGLTSRMQDLGAIVGKTRDLPAAILGRALDVANNAVSVSNQFLDEMSRPSAESLSTREKLSTLTRTVAYYGAVKGQAEAMSDANNEFSIVASRRKSALAAHGGDSRFSAGDVLAVYLPRLGDTWTKIAISYYGTDLGAALARANGFPGYSIVPPRTAIVIPTKATLSASSLGAV